MRVAALAPEGTRVDERLVSLVRKDLVRPERAMVADDEAFRFRHLLIRDTAYDAMPKAVRADLHERFAAWLESHAAELVESDELIGYHLEQAYRYRVELGPLDDAERGLAEQAAGHLFLGAERALGRGDDRAAAALLSHAVDLLPVDHPERRAAQVELSVLLAEDGQQTRAETLRAEAAAAARAAGDERVLARLLLAKVSAEIVYDPTVTMRDSLATCEEALAELERLGDDEGAIQALRLTGNFKGWLGSAVESERLWLQALERAEHVSVRLADDVRQWLLWAPWFGPTPVDSGIRRCDEFLRQSSSKRVEATALLLRGHLKAARGSVQEGRDEAAAGRSLFHELGVMLWWAGSAMVAGDIELMADEPERAYELLSEGHTVLAESSETGYLSTVVGLRAQAALELGRLDEALELVAETERLAQKDDFEPHARRRLVAARVLARQGDVAAAEVLIREAAEIIAPTDYTMLHMELAFAGADVDRHAGRPDDERRALERALELATAKGCVLFEERARRHLAELRGS